MKKLVIPGFPQIPFRNRFISGSEGLNEAIDLPDCGGQVFLLKFNPGDKRPNHTHDEIRLTFVRSGKMRLVVEDKPQEMVPGDFFASYPKVPHSLEVLGDQPLHLIEVVIPNPCQKNQ